ncbi:sensor histidine kinase [Fodinibius salsisoli]|uniref:Signal transduction histidine-protein kinase/phosphatase MprB n=1 Tax=Fodinibius salsisoli TaxID=2820877 RepID=A0ABT3PNL0_9BACT|nr:HAMP domain-containing sensor histidine kinase [Fodinibius salsisoli]MCW9707439.1 HAMP domain-containing protein [Fodinibius salsisoli]
MKNSLNTQRTYYLLGWTLVGLLLVLLALEGWRYGVKPSEEDNLQRIEQQLTTAAQRFQTKQHELLQRSEKLAATLQTPLIRSQPPSDLYQLLSPYTDLWSIALFQNNQPIVWRGFALQEREEDLFDEPFESSIVLRQKNNTIFWECHVPFSLQQDDNTTWYRLFTSYRIEQSNPLAIGNSSEYNLFRSEVAKNYPLDFSIFSTPPSDTLKSQQLSNLAGDSVGVVYATDNRFNQMEQEWSQDNQFWRSSYIVLCFLVFVFLFFVGAVDTISWSFALLIQLLFIGIGWLIFNYTDLLFYWAQSLAETTNTSLTTSVVQQLGKVFTNVVFALLATIAIARKLPFFNRKLKATSYLSSIGIASLFGTINALAIPAVFNWIYQYTIIGNIRLLDLRIFPYGRTIVLYLVVGISLLALGILLITLNRFLFRTTRSHIKLSVSILSISFIISLFAVQILVLEQAALNWIFYSSICSFICIAGIALGHSKRNVWIYSLSPLRHVVLASTLIAAISMPMFYQAYLQNLDQELLKTARNFAREEDNQAEQLTEQLLITLEKEFRSVTYDDIRNNPSSLQARFTQTIQNFLQPQWNSYSFDLQLVNRYEELIADYSTNLNSPEWVDDFSINSYELATEILQITKSAIRPVVQQPNVVNQEDYSTFYRGWIPVYGPSTQTPIAWILCSVYKERPQFNKPIRAVMASLTYEDWNSAFLMQKYENEQLVNTRQQGFAGYFPKYQRLNQSEVQALASDSLIYFTNNTAESTYRTLLRKESEAASIKISTSLAEYRVILFSFFRFCFTLLIVGCLIALILHLLSGGYLPFLGEKKRFQDRILDSFLLATLIFLGFLIATSHYAIKQQNQDIVRQELFDKLERLAGSIESNEMVRNHLNLGSSFSLESLATPWNADATLYTKHNAQHKVSETTTPQIYQQHLLPTALPYEIFNQLYVQQQRDAFATVNLAGQSLLIGYRLILNQEREPVATLAIPTFLESPKYDQQLLETTSYLILAYLLVFGLFILGSAFISKSLTRPLNYIQSGLNKISGGNLDTTIPVTSHDEIGNLAKAYNKMVFRLKKLQKELAEAEREAAWKEMAQQVAHEIKNPLTPMKLNVQHLERQLKTGNNEGPELKARIQKITGNLIEQIQSLSNIASDFSKFSQPVEEDFTTVDLGALLTSVAQLYEHDKKMDISLQLSSRPIKVQGATDDLKRVFINMVKNAYEAMDGEGGHIALSLYERKGHAFVEVEDNGRGIPEENRGNVFVPSFSTKSGGTGLGLAICKKIIDAHGGSISFASVEGEGTTFVIKLALS